MAHEVALRIEELNRELKATKDKHLKMKHKTTTNLMEAMKLKRKMVEIETEIACQRTLYFKYLESMRRMAAWKERGML